MPNVNVGNAILCEYVGQGSNGKHVLVNVYSGDILVDELPADINFAVYLEVITGVEKIDVELVLGGTTFMRGSAISEHANENQTTVFALPLFQLNVKEPAAIEVFLSAEGYDRTLALRKSIYLNPNRHSPTASQPPSSQSPPGGPAP